MGDLSDMNDVARVLRSTEGTARLDGIRASLAGRTIADVEFINDTHAVAILLHLDDGDRFVAMDPSLDVDALREEFAEVIERERIVDYPPNVVRKVVARDRRRK